MEGSKEEERRRQGAREERSRKWFEEREERIRRERNREDGWRGLGRTWPGRGAGKREKTGESGGGRDGV